MVKTLIYKVVHHLHWNVRHGAFIQIISILTAVGINESYAQCSFNASIQTPVSNCLGVTLEITSDQKLSRITWKKDEVIVNTETAITAYNPHGITMAGGIFSGPGLGSFNAPNGIFVDQAGNFYVSDYNNQRVTKWLPGATSGIVVAGGNGLGSAANQLYGANGVCVSSNGDVYVVDLNNHRVQKWAPGATTGITVAGGNGLGSAPNQLNFPDAIFIDTDNNLYISDSENNRVQKWAPGATSGTTVAGGNGYGSAANQLSNPTGLYVDALGNVYVCDGSNGRVQEWTPGAISGITVAGGSGIPGSIGVPYGIFLEPNGNLLVSSLTSNTVQEWIPGAPTGKIIAGLGFVNDTDLGLSNPSALFVDANGDLWVTDELNYRIQKFILTSSIDETYTPPLPGTYTTAITDQAGCTIQSNAIIIYPYTTPAVSINTPDPSICEGEPVVFSAIPVNGGDQPTFQWQVNNINKGTNSTEYNDPSVANGDIIQCILTSNAHCTTVATAISNPIVMKISSGIKPDVSISSTPEIICSGNTITITAKTTSGKDYSYQWLVNGVAEGYDMPAFSSNFFNNGDMINCRISESGGTGCSNAMSNTLVLSINPTPVVISSNIYASPGETIVLDPEVTGDIATYTWSPDPDLSSLNIKNPTAVPSKSTTYFLQVSSPEGCIANGQIKVSINSPIKIPNAFSPNNDGKNDIFFVMGECESCIVERFEVYDRWGQKIFQNSNIKLNDPMAGWNGTVAGVGSPVGVYVYFITIDKPGGKETYKGTLLLIR